jgi:hypothetical protein
VDPDGMKAKSFAEGDDADIPGAMGRNLGGSLDWDRQWGDILTRAFLTAYFRAISEQTANDGGGGGGSATGNASTAGVRGALVSVAEKNGKSYLRITATVYVYSNILGLDNVKMYAAKIQSVYFDVCVEGITKDGAESVIANELKNDMSFFSLDGKDESHTQILDQSRHSEFNVDLLESSGYTDAAHEFGHVLGYYLNKFTMTDGSRNPKLVEVLGTETHSNFKYPEEANFIMAPFNPLNPFSRRVDAIEYKRINGGKGLNFASHPKPTYIGNHFSAPPRLIP